ncbi:MAG: hypothetical protein V4611_00185 [Patescibacteria group bacterium]
MQDAQRYWDAPTATIDGTPQQFWPGDVVEFTDNTVWGTWEHQPATTQEVIVEYGYVAPYDNHWAYSLRLDDDPRWLGRGHVGEDRLSLVRRGNLWNYHHGQPLAFKNVTEEGQFFFNLGHVTPVRSWDGSDFWYLPRLMKAMSRGKVDTFTRRSHYNRAYKFEDPEVGRRVRLFTLNEYKNWKEDIPRSEW